MGTRIHKVLGYGLTNAKEHIISDNYGNHDFWSTTVKPKDIFDWSKANGIQPNASRIYRDHDETIDRLIHYDDEYGDENVLVITLPDEGWHRYADDLDAYEHSIRYESYETHVDVLKHTTLYPYSFFVNVDTGERLYPDEFRVLCSHFGGINGWKNFCDDGETLKKYSNIKTLEDFERTIKPELPDIVQYIVWKSGLFKNPLKTIKQLTPMIYTYWS